MVDSWHVWKIAQLDDCIETIIDYRGKSVPKADDGVQLITARNVRQGYVDLSYEEYIPADIYNSWMDRGIPQKADVLFTTEAPLGMVAMYPEREQYALGQRLVAIRTDHQVLNPEFLLQYFLSDFGQNEIHSRSSGSTAIGIKQRELRKLQVPLPPLAEQRKIAAILSTWDEAITLTGQLIAALQRRKQALMQLLLTGAVRFPEFEDSTWETHALSEVFERATRKNAVGNTNVLTMSAQEGLISQSDFFNKIVAGKARENYYLLKKGEFAYNKSYSNGYPFGAIKRLERYEEGILSTLYICFRLIDGLGDPDFYTYYFESGALNEGISTIAQEGARNHGLLNISIGDFFDLPIDVPEMEEQHRIAEVFRAHDEIERSVVQQLERLQTQKRGLMQQLLTGAVRVRTD